MKAILLRLNFFTVPVFLLISCAVREPVETDPLRSDLFEKVSLIMLEEEEEAYRNLPDIESRERFMEEFWKKRDPDPTTEENEFVQEFTERIEEANELFGYGFGSKGMNTGRGWNSDQGRIYLVLGPPDRIRRFSREVEPAMRSGVDDPRRGQIPEAVQIE